MRCQVIFSFVRLCGLAALLIVAQNANGQNQEIADVVTKFNAFSRDNLHEKIFVHTDKETYLSNEILWIKIYNVDEMQHMPLGLSRVAYVELLDVRSQESVLQTKVELRNGKGSGSMELTGLPTGTYRFRAYTRWMRNFDQRYFFDKTITVINTQNVQAERQAQEAGMVQASFYPEGGNLVEGLTSVVGFRISDNFGKGLKATGVIVDQNNSPVVNFEPSAFGIGQFRFTPQKGVQYKAVVTYEGKSATYPFPEIIPGGYVMDVKGAGKLTVTVTRNNPAIESDYVLLLAHTRQQVKSVLVAFFKENKAVFTIDKNKLGDGISHITVFDRLKNPICERLVFKAPVNQLIIDSRPQAYQFSTREEVKVSIATYDSKTLPVAADMSFSVYAIDSLQQVPYPMGMASYMYLVSDLGGQIEEPDYYFSQKDSVDHSEVDNLMLTYGWRKFDWKQVIKDVQPPLQFAPEYGGQIISGISRDEATGRMADTARVYLSVAGKNPKFKGVKTDHQGNFDVLVHELYGQKPVIFQAGGNSVQLKDAFDARRDGTLVHDFVPGKTVEQTLTASNVHTQVQKVFYPADEFSRIEPDTSRFYGRPTIAYNLDDYVRFPTLEDVFREYVPGVIVRRPAGRKSQVFVVDNAKELFFDKEPLILLDGLPVLNTDMLLSTDASTVKRVAVVNQKYFMGDVVYNGILDISTYKGNLGAFDIDPTAVVIDYDGLQRSRIFNSPDYSTAESRTSRMPDFRNMLYWNPNVETDASGNQMIRFFTSDKRGNFVAVIHGMTANGLMGSKTFLISVK